MVDSLESIKQTLPCLLTHNPLSTNLFTTNIDIHKDSVGLAMTQTEELQKEILEVYKVNEPFGTAAITKDPETHELQYAVFEPTLTEEEKKNFQQIRDFLIERLDVAMSELEGEKKAEEYLEKQVIKIVKDFNIQVNEFSLEKILYYIIRDYVGYSKIDVIMRDPLIEDISCNGANTPVYIWHREYESVQSNVIFSSEAELNSFVVRLAYRTGRMISMANPILDASLPDGSRIQMTFGKVVTKGGSTFSIRKFKSDPYTIVDLIKLGTLSSSIAALSWYLIENKYNIFVCGPTASGKTTTLNCLANFIHPNYKVVTIEDTPEIKLHQENWFRSVTRPSVGTASEISLFDLLKAAMRQRPDYIIVGEIRGSEAYTLFQAIATGHGGISTLHADSVASVVHRLETEPMNIPRSLVIGLNVIMIQQRLQIGDKPARRLITTTELVGLDTRTNEIITNELFKYKPDEDNYQYSDRSYHLEKIAKWLGKSMKEITDEIEKRKVILDWMAKNNIRSFKQVSDVIRSFYANPEEALNLAKVGA